VGQCSFLFGGSSKIQLFLSSLQNHAGNLWKNRMLAPSLPWIHLFEVHFIEIQD